MQVGLLLITHDALGELLLESARVTFGNLPLSAEALAVAWDQEPEDVHEQARALCDRLDDGAGVLILTDIYGATPANIACRLSGPKVRVVAGLNLPMLLKVCSYAGLDLPSLEQKAYEGGRGGVLYGCGPDGVCNLDKTPHG